MAPPKDDHISSSNQTPHKPAGVKVHLGPGYRMKDGKVEKIKGFGLNASQKQKQRKSKRVKPVKPTP